MHRIVLIAALVMVSAILIALISPIILSARATHETGVTFRNLKRLATGVAQYLADNDDTFFPRDYVGALKPYVPDVERLGDPRHHRPFSFNTNLYGVKVKGVKNLDRLILFYTRDEPLENKAVPDSLLVCVDGTYHRLLKDTPVDWLPKF